MNDYEKLVQFAHNLGIEVVEKHFKSNAKGLCKGNKIGISKDIERNEEKLCVLAEEIAHSLFTVGNILDQNNVFNVKQEEFAKRKAYEALLPLSALVDAYFQQFSSVYEMAEYLGVTESFLNSSLRHYQRKYGVYVKHDKWLIYFSPLKVHEAITYTA